jgi:hypothetical protein
MNIWMSNIMNVVIFYNFVRFLVGLTPSYMQSQQ